MNRCTRTTGALALAALFAAKAAPAQQPGASTPATDSGTIARAPFRIDVPAKWNGSLVIFAHGYEGFGPGPGRMPARPRALYLNRGFAVAQSGYHAQGWAVAEALQDIDSLYARFVAAHGKPRETYIAGESMGGHITAATFELHPERYTGALSLCGAIAPSFDLFNGELFEMLVTFDYLFPGALKGPYGDGTPAPQRGPLIQQAIQAAPERAAMYATHYGRQVADVPGWIGFFQGIAAELRGRAGGNPFDNRNTVYAGFGDDSAMNAGIMRYAADDRAVDYIRRYYTTTGRIAHPMLAVHTTYDPIVNPNQVTKYDVLTREAGTQNLFAANFVVAKGHCAFTNEQVAGAFDALLSWVHTGQRPASGPVVPHPVMVP